MARRTASRVFLLCATLSVGQGFVLPVPVVSRPVTLRPLLQQPLAARHSAVLALSTVVAPGTTELGAPKQDGPSIWAALRRLCVAVCGVFIVQSFLAGIIALQLSFAATASGFTSVALGSVAAHRRQSAITVAVAVLAVLLAPEIFRTLRSIGAALRDRIVSGKDAIASARTTARASRAAAAKVKELEQAAAAAERAAEAEQEKARAAAKAKADEEARAAAIARAAEQAKRTADVERYRAEALAADQKAMAEARAALEGLGGGGGGGKSAEGDAALERAAEAQGARDAQLRALRAQLAKQVLAFERMQARALKAEMKNP